jgi:hypothetical protein
MNQQKSERNNLLGSSVLIVLLLLFISVFSHKLISSTDEVSRYEIGYVLNSNTDKAILINDIHVPSFQYSWISLIDKMSINIFDRNFKTYSDNKFVNHKIQLLRKIKLSTTPVKLNNYHLHLFPEELEDPLILS